jgi:hypothetical protein
MTARKPKVLFVYYTYSQQTRSLVEVMAGALRDRGCEVQQAKIEFTDPRYAERFSRFRFVMLTSIFSRCSRLRCGGQPERSAFQTRQGKEITTLYASVRRHGG